VQGCKETASGWPNSSLGPDGCKYLRRDVRARLLVMGQYMLGVIAVIVCIVTVIIILKEIGKMDWNF